MEDATHEDVADDAESSPPVVQLINLDVITKTRSERDKACCAWLMALAKEQQNCEITSKEAFQKAIKQCSKQELALMKSKKKVDGQEKLHGFLSSPFKLPRKSVPDRPLPVQPRSSCHSVFNECGHENTANDFSRELVTRTADIK